MLRSILIRGGILSCLLCANTFAQSPGGPTVLQPPGDSPPTKATDQKPAPAGRGTFEALKRYSPRRAIVDAPFLKASEVTDQVSDNELVLGVEIEGQARAYPINMLTGPSREIINDTIGKTHLAATW